ncbi:hypothetical protein FDI24_gp009 [Acidovorax phage ACP17]|uniref:Uncharacterized protein n=1 Tax=Acidovorax phage ACP17 TaxID=2010329 RepID=A0A218M3B4_9CAUD|nr:hypothetical protein FDI24_gp009 [Acidovorax phage ACP17]ASD50543.1 hypothetical protein [Acidovorax phage ACP17]
MPTLKDILLASCIHIFWLVILGYIFWPEMKKKLWAVDQTEADRRFSQALEDSAKAHRQRLRSAWESFSEPK